MPEAAPEGRKRYRRSSRLLRPEQFRRALRRGAAANSAALDLFVCRNELSEPRLGLIVGRRELPRAVDRNRARRALRESFRQELSQIGALDLVVRVKRISSQRQIKALGNEFAVMLKELRP